MIKTALCSGIIFCFIAVALGAFGAHAIKQRVSADMLVIWNTAVTYQFFHALALILLGVWMKQSATEANAAFWFFSAGIIIFSGSLYALVLLDMKVLGAVTPIGGVCFLVGWVLWLMAVVKN